ncbi:hypothetical protein HJD18_16690 [Thermoleophilia bacterium SCSIO 60948]|nr:hypothetical protein HJD18_16690 [Thermoleophilia bacterium SCSIO 60948]
MLGALLLSVAAVVVGLLYALLTAIANRRRRPPAAPSSPIDGYLVGRTDDDGAALYVLDEHGVRRIARVRLPDDLAASSHRLIALLRHGRAGAPPAKPATMDIRLPEDWREEGFSVPLTTAAPTGRRRRRDGRRGISPRARRR